MKHKHHIIPKHAGGSDDPANLIELTVEEHAQAHRELYETYGRTQDKLAWKGLAGLIGHDEIMYELMSMPKSEEHKRKISESHKGMSKPWAVGGKGNLGKAKTKEHKRKISEAHKGMSKPWMAGNSNACGPRPKTEAHQTAVTEALNRPEVKAKIAATRAAKPIVTCPHCGKQGKQGHNMKRYHFDNCKEI